MTEDAVVNGSSVVKCAYMYDYELAYGKWYRSSLPRGGIYPFPSYMLNKKWTMEEEFNNHMLIFQQVTVGSIYLNKQHFDIPGRIDSH